MATAIPADALAAARRYGPSVDAIARRYRNPKTGQPLSGVALLLKLSSGENGLRMGGSPSSAGARGATQFTPGSREVAIRKFGIDPWRSYDEAFHAASLHLRGKINGSTGLEGYNPGGGRGYVDYILGQSIGPVGGSLGSGSAGSSGSSPAPVVSMPQPEIVPGSAALTQALVAEQAPRSVAPLALPAFAAQPVLPKGAAVFGSVAPPLRTDALAAALAAARSASPAVATATGGGSMGSPAASAGSAPRLSGHKLQLPTDFKPTHQTSGLPGYPALDVFGKPGTPVGSPISGTVIKLSGKDPSAGAYEGQGGPFGYSVYVSDGRRTYFLTHFGSRDVRVGQRVSRGQILGTVGNYPGATPDHIHVGLNRH